MERAGAAGGGAGNPPPAGPAPSARAHSVRPGDRAPGTKVAAEWSAKSQLSKRGARAISSVCSQEPGEPGILSRSHSGGDTFRRKLRSHRTASHIFFLLRFPSSPRSPVSLKSPPSSPACAPSAATQDTKLVLSLESPHLMAAVVFKHYEN